MAVSTPFRRLEVTSAPLRDAGQILIVSGDSSFAVETGEQLKSNQFTVFTASCPEQAMEFLETDALSDLILLDAGDDSKRLSAWIKQIRSCQPSAKKPNLDSANEDLAEGSVILLAVDAENISHATDALQLGDYDCVIRPFSEQQLLASVRRAVQYRRLKVENDRFRDHIEQAIGARTRILQHTMQQLEQSYDITLEALGDALDLKDAETEGHSKRVTAYTLALGRVVGLSEPQLRLVGRGAFLHDIGKMAIPDAILRKPGKLTTEERDIMRTHSELGYRMIQKIPYLREAAEIVYAHQECYDGSGYPRGLRGEQIHIGARIFALADTLDAITSNRPYRKAATIAEARKEVLRCAGTQFDPAIVDVFVATPDSIWLNLREGIMRDGTEFSPFGYTFGRIS